MLFNIKFVDYYYRDVEMDKIENPIQVMTEIFLDTCRSHS